MSVLYVHPRGAADIAAAIRSSCRDHRYEIVEAIEASDVQEALAARAGAPPEAVCLIGGGDDLPHARFDDPTGTEEWVLTDNDYGCARPLHDADRAHADGLPDVPVCRIPTRDIDVVERLLRVRADLPATWAGGVAVSTQKWAQASAEVQRQMGAEAAGVLRQSPPWDAKRDDSPLGEGAGRLYFNVHGSDQVPWWVGDGGGEYPRAFEANDVEGVLNNALLVSEACYGARHDEGAENIAIAFLMAGGSAFVGSTIIAWGPPEPPISLADVIVCETVRALDQGYALPEALLRAKQLVARSGRLSPQAANTVSSFQAFGPPLARVAGVRPKATTPSVAAAPPSAPDNLLARVRAARDARGGGGPLGAARESLRGRGERLGWSAPADLDLSIEALRARFARAADIQARLQALLGHAPTRAHVVEYGDGAEMRRLIVARGRPGSAPVAVVVDVSGGVVESLVAHGGRS